MRACAKSSKFLVMGKHHHRVEQSAGLAVLSGTEAAHVVDTPTTSVRNLRGLALKFHSGMEWGRPCRGKAMKIFVREWEWGGWGLQNLANITTVEQSVGLERGGVASDTKASQVSPHTHTHPPPTPTADDFGA